MRKILKFFGFGGLLVGLGGLAEAENIKLAIMFILFGAILMLIETMIEGASDVKEISEIHSCKHIGHDASRPSYLR